MYVLLHYPEVPDFLNLEDGEENIVNQDILRLQPTVIGMRTMIDSAISNELAGRVFETHELYFADFRVTLNAAISECSLDC
jgi:hypothetical protein